MPQRSTLIIAAIGDLTKSEFDAQVLWNIFPAARRGRTGKADSQAQPTQTPNRPERVFGAVAHLGKM
jgi:hypothetical protein